jgi:hypothetical protein
VATASTLALAIKDAIDLTIYVPPLCPHFAHCSHLKKLFVTMARIAIGDVSPLARGEPANQLD